MDWIIENGPVIGVDLFMGASNMEGFQNAAKDAMGKMSPEQMAEARKMIEDMSDQEKMDILKMFTQRFDSGKQ